MNLHSQLKYAQRRLETKFKSHQLFELSSCFDIIIIATRGADLYITQHLFLTA